MGRSTGRSTGRTKKLQVILRRWPFFRGHLFDVKFLVASALSSLLDLSGNWKVARQSISGLIEFQQSKRQYSPEIDNRSIGMALLHPKSFLSSPGALPLLGT